MGGQYFPSQIANPNKHSIILCYPYIEGEVKQLPLGLWKVAEYCNREFDIYFIDARLETDVIKTIEDCLSNSNPIYIGLSVMTGSQIFNALQISKHFSKRIPIVWGGMHPTILPDETISNEYIDHIVVGEGESQALLLAQYLLNRPNGRLKLKNHNTAPFLFKIHSGFTEEINCNLLLDINEKYLIARDGIERGLNIETSRGCPFTCGFCHNSVRPAPRYRTMQPNNIIVFIDHLTKKYSLTGVIFQEDNFLVDPKSYNVVIEHLIKKGHLRWKANARISAFCYKDDDILKRELEQLVQSGCNCLQFGIESGDNDTLQFIQKGHTIEQAFKVNKLLAKFPISVRYNFIIGFPGESRNSITNTMNCIDKLRHENINAESPFVNIYTPYPRTPLYDMAIKSGFEAPRNLLEWANLRWNTPSETLHKDSYNQLLNISNEYLKVSSYSKFVKG